MKVLLTRPLADSQRIAEQLNAYGIDSLIWPLTQVELIPAPVEIPSDVEALVFSSGHAIHAFCRGNPARTQRVFCVGSRTADLARAEGFETVLAAGGNFEALVALIRAEKPESVLYLRGKDVSGDMEQALQSDGIRCVSRIVYAAQPSGPPDPAVDAALSTGEVAVITVWSHRNAALLDESIQKRKDWNINKISLIGISENAVADLGNTGFRRIIVASRPNATQMIAEIRAAVR